MAKINSQRDPFWQSLFRSSRQILRALGKASTGAFKPAEEKLPEVGVQPYEGDPAPKHDHTHSS